MPALSAVIIPADALTRIKRIGRSTMEITRPKDGPARSAFFLLRSQHCIFGNRNIKPLCKWYRYRITDQIFRDNKHESQDSDRSQVWGRLPVISMGAGVGGMADPMPRPAVIGST